MNTNTEQQAKELWCPMVRHEGGDGGTFNRGYFDDNPLNAGTTRNGMQPHNSCACIASKCAMWRWDENQPRRDFEHARNQAADTVENAGGTRFRAAPPEGWEFCPAEDDPAGWIEPEAQWLARRTGYCGLAGKP